VVSLQVYLDSSDYSVLSNPQCQTPALGAIRDKLFSWANSGDVEFRYSAAHICEMAPLAGTDGRAAEARADILFELCGHKTLLSADKVIIKELSILSEEGGTPIEIRSENGNWFPDLEGIFPTALAPSRKDRRNPPPYLKQAVKEIVSQFPMRHLSAKTLSSYLLGLETKEAAETAFLQSFREPTWLMRWFAKNGNMMTPIIDWMRGPSKSLLESTKATAIEFARIREAFSREAPKGTPLPGTDKKARAELRNQQLQRIALRITEGEGIVIQSLPDIAAIEQYAPGFTISISVWVDSVWRSISETPRAPKESDFVDAIHAVYAPYVDIFRTDSYMADLMKKPASTHGTQVVGLLSDLVPAIEARLSHKQ